jgi:hypothetical protein
MEIKLVQQREKERKGEKGQMGGRRREKRIRYGGMIFYKVSFIMVLHNRLLLALLMLLFI